MAYKASFVPVYTAQSSLPRENVNNQVMQDSEGSGH